MTPICRDVGLTHQLGVLTSLGPGRDAYGPNGSDRRARLRKALLDLESWRKCSMPSRVGADRAEGPWSRTSTMRLGIPANADGIAAFE